MKQLGLTMASTLATCYALAVGSNMVSQDLLLTPFAPALAEEDEVLIVLLI